MPPQSERLGDEASLTSNQGFSTGKEAFPHIGRHSRYTDVESVQRHFKNSILGIRWKLIQVLSRWQQPLNLPHAIHFCLICNRDHEELVALMEADDAVGETATRRVYSLPLGSAMITVRGHPQNHLERPVC